MSRSLLIFTISPVQGFIAEARRAHDLWAGSQILVGLIRRAARAAETAGAEIIYPANLAQDSLPNRFVARIGADNNVDEVVRAAVDAVHAQWSDYTDDARKRLSAQVPIEPTWEWNTIWDRQVAHHGEIHWSVATAAPNDYGAAYRFVSAGLGARKRLRDFVQSEESGPKDSFSGMRSALWIPSGDGDTNAAVKSYWTQVAGAFAKKTSTDYVPTILQPDGRERLDAIGATKRFTRKFPEGNKFPSVSSIAAADFRKRIARKKAETQRAAHASALEALGIFPPGNALRNTTLARWDFDGDTLYAETLRPDALKDYHLDVKEVDPRLTAARTSLRRLYDAVGAPPSTYYAILAMDGDQMGRRVGACQTEKEHHDLSDALARFAEKATGIVEQEYAGRVVYAGGDDLLALLPLVEALPAASAIRQAFGETIPPTADEVKAKRTASISAGIAFAHHRAPLDAAVRAARQSEDVAKREYRRDALCIVALKRSGERVQVGTNWQFGHQLAIIKNVIDDFQNEAAPLSSKFAFDVYAEARALADSREAFDARIKWLVRRHGPKLTDDRVTELKDGIVTMTTELDDLFKRQNDSPERRRGTLEMGYWLLLARFLAQGGAD